MNVYFENIPVSSHDKYYVSCSKRTVLFVPFRRTNFNDIVSFVISGVKLLFSKAGHISVNLTLILFVLFIQ